MRPEFETASRAIHTDLQSVADTSYYSLLIIQVLLLAPTRVYANIETTGPLASDSRVSQSYYTCSKHAVIARPPSSAFPGGRVGEVMFHCYFSY
jgi:hypothetical protein